MRVSPHSLVVPALLAAASSAAAQAPGTDIYLLPLTVRGGVVTIGPAQNLTNRAGYDNQPAFSPDGRSVLFTSVRDDAQADIWRVDVRSRQASRVTDTPESEYSATPVARGGMVVVRVEQDSTQRLWHFPARGAPRVMLPGLRPVGYFAFADTSTVVMFVLGQPSTLQIGNVTTGSLRAVAQDVGRSIHRIPGSTRVSYVQKGASGWTVRALDTAREVWEILAPMGPRTEDYAWASPDVMLMARGDTLHRFHVGHDSAWVPVAPLALRNASRLAVSPDGRSLAIVARDGDGSSGSERVSGRRGPDPRSRTVRRVAP